MKALLSINQVDLSFEGIKALSNVSATVAEGRITAFIGPNGAGKTSLFNVISGFYRPQSGVVQYNDINLLTLPPYARSPRGIARTFQNIALFAGMTVLENIKLGAHAMLHSNVLTAGLYLGWAKREEDELTRWITAEVLDFLHLTRERDKPVTGLPYGVLKRVELARALAMRPRLLLLDEPFAGMNTAEKVSMAEDIRRCIKEKNCTAMLIDHDMEAVMTLSSHVVVLNFGEVIASGTPEHVQRDSKVIEAYLGAE